MVTPTSYLQTLANDEAIAFVASLQSVKAHLSQSLHWMSEQVQQKTAQLQGIETLLFEAEALGLVAAAADSISEATATDATHKSDFELPANTNGSTASVKATEPVASAIAALPVKDPSKQQRSKQGKLDSVKTPRGSKPLATTTSAAKAKPSTLPASKANPRGKASNLQQFLQNQWRDKALTQAVGDILNRASTPLSTDEVMAELYDGLPKADYQRVKHSLANILSVGRSKGTWKSTGRGLYAGNALAPAP